jgi:hypothetical protein
MADKAIGEAAEKAAAEGGVVAIAPNPAAEAAEQAEQAPESLTKDVMRSDEQAASAVVQQWMARMQTRQDKLEQDLAAALERESRFAKGDHAHPHDASTQVLIDALGELDREEVAPSRARWWQRRIGR